MSKNVLKIENATMQFGGVVAVDNLNLEINQGEIVALIGPNGAGKTTAFNVVTGVFRPTEGQVLFNGSRIDGMKRFKVTKAGVARTFQNIRLFHNMSAVENVMVGVDAHHRTGAVGAALGLSRNVGAVGTSPAQTQSVGFVGGIVLLAIIFVSYLAGGYVAGRMARFNGVKQGLGVWLWAVIFTIVVGVLGFVAGNQVDLMSRANGLPRLPVNSDALAGGGIITVAAIVLISLVGALLGGLAGMRYHRRVDRAGFDEV